MLQKVNFPNKLASVQTFISLSYYI